MTNRRQLLLGGLVPALVPVALVEAHEEILELRWTTDLPTQPGQYLRRNPAVHSFTRCYVHAYMLQGEMNPIELCEPPHQYFGPLPLPWEMEDDITCQTCKSCDPGWHYHWCPRKPR